MKNRTIIPIAIILLVFSYFMYQKGCNNELSKRPNYPTINVDSLILVNIREDSAYFANKAQREQNKPKVDVMSKSEIKAYYDALVNRRTDIRYIHDTTYLMTDLDSCQQLALMYSIDYDICAEQLTDCEVQMAKKNVLIDTLGKSLKASDSKILELESEVLSLNNKSKRLKRLMAGITAALIGVLIVK